MKLDPTIPVTERALHTQLEINLKLRDMQSSVNDALRGIDSYKAPDRDGRRRPCARSIRRPRSCWRRC